MIDSYGDISELLRNSDRKTLIRIFISCDTLIEFPNCKYVHGGSFEVAEGALEDIEPVLKANESAVNGCIIDVISRKSILGEADLTGFDARIEQGAFIRESAVIEKNAVIMHGAVINCGARICEGAMIDMNAVIGSRAVIGSYSHIGAGAVIAGVLEPPSLKPVTIKSGAFIGANAVVLEGISVGEGAVIGAGAVVTHDIPENCIAVGIPARIKGKRTEKTSKCDISKELRK